MDNNLSPSPCLPSTSAITEIPAESAHAYLQKSEAMIDFVNSKMAEIPEINTLIGNNPIEVMQNNHRNHVYFMSTFFRLNNPSLLTFTIPWVYHTYHSHNFQYDYFPTELVFWKQAINMHLNPSEYLPIINTYNWIIENHDNWVELSENSALHASTAPDDWQAVKSSFLEALISGNHKTCLEIAQREVDSIDKLEPFYLYVLQTSLYDIGNLWQRGLISVAQEHLASAIVGRTMSAIYATNLVINNHKGKAIVTCAPNEHHEIGAWMISDLLESDGWNTRYLGADTPAQDLIKLMRDFQPGILAISITMAFNLDNCKSLIEAIRKDPLIRDTYILVGGIIFNGVDNLWQSIGADASASNVSEARKVAEKWLNQQKDTHELPFHIQ